MGSIHSQYSFSPAGTGSDLAFDLANATDNTRGTDTPPSSATLLKASSEMSIEAMLRWPIFEQRLGNLSSISLVEDLGKVSAADSFTNDGTRERAAYEVLNLERNTVSRLIENFLVNNLPSNPILDPVSLRRDGQEVVDSGLRWDGKTCLIVSARRHPPFELNMSHNLTSLVASRSRHWKYRNLHSIPPAEWAHLVGSERACVQSGRDVFSGIATSNWGSILPELPTRLTMCVLHCSISESYHEDNGVLESLCPGWNPMPGIPSFKRIDGRGTKA